MGVAEEKCKKSLFFFFLSVFSTIFPLIACSSCARERYLCYFFAFPHNKVFSAATLCRLFLRRFALSIITPPLRSVDYFKKNLRMSKKNSNFASKILLMKKRLFFLCICAFILATMSAGAVENIWLNYEGQIQ